MYTDIDYDILRKDLIDYYGTAMMYNPMAVVELGIVENASYEKLIEIAIKNGFDLTNYENQKIKKIKGSVL